jgi:hypothetical protein
VLSISKFVPVSKLHDFLDAAMHTDYSVIESRRELHVRLAEITETSQKGSDMFTMQERFPNAMKDLYMCTKDGVFINVMLSLASNLSWRSTTVAKDTAEGSGSGKTESNVQISKEQGVQDNFKRFEELLKTLARTIGQPDLLWDRESFEERTNAVWTATTTSD